MKRRIWALAALGVGGGLAWLAVQGMPWHEVLSAMAGLDSRMLVLAVGAMLFAGFLEALRWKILLPRERVSMRRLFLVRNAGKGLNNLSPVRVLAEVAQTGMLRFGDGIGAEKVISSLVLSRLFDLLVTVTLVGVGLIVLPQLASLKPVVLPLWGATFGALIGVAVLSRRINRMPRMRRLQPLQAVVESMSAVGTGHKTMLGCLLLTATAWMSIGTAAWLVARTAGIDLPFWLMAIVIVAVTIFASATPAPPGAVGVYEFGAISVLGLFAVDPAAALTFALVTHGMLFFIPVVIGIPVLTAERHTIRRVLAGATAMAHLSGWGAERPGRGLAAERSPEAP